MSQKSAFYSGHSTELQAYSSAAKNLEKEGIDQSVDLDKAIGFTEQLERKIEETKEQLRETNSEEKKAQQERKKVLDITRQHSPHRHLLQQPHLSTPFRRPATQATLLCWLSLCLSAVVQPLEQPLLPARKSTTDNGTAP